MDDDENRNNFIRREQHYVHLQPDILVPEVRNVENRQYRRERSASPGGPAGANVFVNPSPPPPPPRPPPQVFGGPSRSPSPPRNPRGQSRVPPVIYRARRHSHRRASPEPVRINIKGPQTPDVTFLAQHYFESGGGIGDLEYLRQRFGTGRERKKITKLRKHRKPEDGPVVLGFFCWRKGMRVDDDRKITFRFNKHKDDGDTWLIDRMKNSYRTRLNRSLIFPLRTVGFAKYIRMQKIEKRWRVTAQQTVEKYKDSSSISRFVYRLRYPFTNRTIRPWMKTLETLIEQAEGECIMLVELFEVPNTATIYWLLYIAIFLCTGGGVAYAVVQKDVATGISLSGYLVACMALILALVSAGEFIGLQRPDSYSWAYDIVDGEEAWEISNLEEEAWKTYNTHMDDQP